MSRIPLVNPESAPPEVAALYERLMSWDTPIFNVIQLFGNHPGFLESIVGIFEQLYVTAKLVPRYRELAYLRASQLNACHY